MKILIDARVLSHAQVTGVENHAINIIKSLQEKINITIAKPKYHNRYYTHFWEHFILPLRALKYDILFSPSNIAPIFLPKRIKLIVTLHDLAFKDFPHLTSSLFRRYYSFVVPKVIKRADKVLTISNFSQKRIIKEYPFLIDKIATIYHGKNEIFYHDKGVKRDSYLLYVGSLNDIKNFSSVIKAFEILDNAKYRLKMVMPIGANFIIDSDKEELLERAKEHPRIEIVDYLEQKSLVTLYQQAKLFVFPSYHESFGFPVLEAMACGTPVVCSREGALSEVGGDAVLYCDPYSVEDICDKIEQVLDDQRVQEQMIAKGLERAKGFSWEKSAKEHIRVFKEVLKS